MKRFLLNFMATSFDVLASELIVVSFRMTIALIGVSTMITLQPSIAEAWGKRGHSIVCQTAAYLAASEPKGSFLKSHSFDLGYYCNVPDLVWKKPDTYQAESNNHFMDMEIFARDLKDSKIEKPFEMDRAAFNKEFPAIGDKAGRAWWRIRELNSALHDLSEELKKSDLSREKRHDLQASWLVHAGAIGHYVGDLAQPLHVTENYDGQLTNQKGIHSFFEEKLVDELFHSKGRINIEHEVMQAAQKRWGREKKKLAAKTDMQLLQDLTAQANKALKTLLETDRKIGRSDLKKASNNFRGQIVEQVVQGSVVLAEFYRRELTWDYNGEKFYTFIGTPEFIAPPKAKPQASPSEKSK